MELLLAVTQNVGATDASTRDHSANNRWRLPERGSYGALAILWAAPGWYT